MVQSNVVSKGRGRPRRDSRTSDEVRSDMIRCGIVAFTENNFFASGIDGILKQAGVPKGSFYYYFENKDAFGIAVLESYRQYFQNKLTKTLQNRSLSPLERVRSFCESCCTSMAKYNFQRGCIVGNMSLEVGMLPELFRERLCQIFEDWCGIMTNCLREAVIADEIKEVNCVLWGEYFWTGWEGAVMRGKLVKSDEPLRNYVECFILGIKI